MGSVLVARGYDLLLSKGYDYANLESNVPNGPTTKVAISSITKQFTADAILLLEERGPLKVKDPIKKYCPEPRSAWNAITIFQLLTHTSGILTLPAFAEFQKIGRFPTTPEEISVLVRGTPLEFERGVRMVYSNLGYVVLGYLIEKVSGEGYQNFVPENILVPLGMKDSGYGPGSAT
jgi:CubicO group peptidase (beta-lactamase class C family)